MADQKKRTSKTSKGTHGGGGKVTLTPLQKVLMGKGLVDSTKVASGQAWRGAREKA